MAYKPRGKKEIRHHVGTVVFPAAAADFYRMLKQVSQISWNLFSNHVGKKRLIGKFT